MAAEMDPVFVGDFAPGYREAESQSPFMIGRIFKIVDEDARLAETVLPRVNSNKQTSGVLIQASRIVARLIERDGLMVWCGNVDFRSIINCSSAHWKSSKAVFVERATVARSIFPYL